MDRWITGAWMARFAHDERGATAIEYALIGGLIALAIVGAISGTGTGVSARWNDFSNTVVGVLR
ncbi:Flp family type IVb pilin [Methyloraptor flagellatus]|jgi:pilus assembly protein Flp/PilA|uniref:Flp family type IVb pilin n=1 Tax=Methyloraptor flagellatus TaxID=3162530 RepID=A0AAU7XCR8_9HYPH